MSNLSLQILQPANGAGFPNADAAPVYLRGQVVGDTTGLFFKWFSSLNLAATKDNPELNTHDHSQGSLSWNSPLNEFGSHVITLAATDQDGNDLASVKAVTRSALAGGPPPTSPRPCVVHLLKAQIRTPSSDGQQVSRANASFEFLAPVKWAKEDPKQSGSWIADSDYQEVNGITFQLALAAVGSSSSPPAWLLTCDLAALAFFRADNNTWFRWTGSLPASLGTGSYNLNLIVSGGGVSTSGVRQVVLIA